MKRKEENDLNEITGEIKSVKNSSKELIPGPTDQTIEGRSVLCKHNARALNGRQVQSVVKCFESPSLLLKRDLLSLVRNARISLGWINELRGSRMLRGNTEDLWHLSPS